MTDGAALLEAARGGDRRALARLLTLVERGGEQSDGVVAAARAFGGAAHVVGITGAPGVGKSSLAAALVAELRRRGHSVGVIAVDPSSPHSGGALLGDRVRMERLHGDPGVFVRSVASRGASGGLADAASAATLVLTAAGFHTVLLETVGAGQADLDVATAAQTVLLVVAPGLGDGVQALKAGIVEIADVIAVNKADHSGADQLVADLAFACGPLGAGAQRIPIVKTVATTGDGIPELADALAAHRAVDGATGAATPVRLAERRVLRAAARRVMAALERAARSDGRLDGLARAVAARRLTADEAARRLLTSGQSEHA
ncbi:MAG TPA: methylmalonyl Co-A mutase-associated GTPase MeaB [Chloroflexota bacterium]|nr:methylmalonyl Co-A mutase-associated GTPase MeaB [Chloroflexota bacterium]